MSLMPGSAARASAASIEILTSLAGIAPAEWDSLFRHAPTPAAPCAAAIDPPREDAESFSEEPESDPEEDRDNPFISHAFLASLERSGSVGGRSGWTPLHLLARDGAGRLLGAVPAYAKGHSRGEYVFDHAFAEAYHRAGGRYYPKLQVSVPFTPATAPKLLVAPGAAAETARAALIAGLEALRQRIDGSSIHATFLTPPDRAALAAAGYLLRADQQFHFRNPGYRDFDAFLESLASRKRKVLRRERRDALAAGITVEWVTGRDLTEAHWDAFFAFYMDTGDRKWGSPYLTRAFFSEVSAAMPERILLILAKRAGRYIAGALNFIGANTLYGRNWGAIEHHPFLHFELCYYQAIDFALARGLARVEAGAQGEHKLARGYGPVKTWSAHRFADPGLHRAVADYLRHEHAEIDRAQAILAGMTPFRKQS
ncbi:GNAT family N-acetyltransferase [Rhabdaerophilum calidifontis]|uniref:GNAT family N-acetyltransferase n=1 Tax=Rhabdaerophilum calidifontis TaxID=2604328 RepID=UPI001FE931D0|nr:GNAT family N-acetyltransferase [Rhabdaerophilum calidifontis]